MSGVDPRLVVDGLVRRGVPLNAAIGLAGNIAVESGFRTDINEIAPLVEGSRGGYGLIQWTGPRRRQFEAFAGQNLNDLDTQLDFIVHELGTTEKRAADAIYAAASPTEAARLVSERFLRPGIPHMDRRLAETERLAGLSSTQPQQNALETASQPAQQPAEAMNRLAMAQQFMPRTNALNAADFQTQPQPANALYGFGAGQNPFMRA